MLLDLEKIREISVGVIDVRLGQDGVIGFRRFTDEQLESFGMQNAGVKKNSQSTTGIRLDFETDSQSFAFTVASDGKYEVLINAATVYCEQMEKNQRAVLSLGIGEKRVTLILPSHSIGSLFGVEVDDGASVNRHKFDCKAIYIGDSITQGWNSKFDSMSWAYRTSFHLNADSLILGVGGASYFAPSFPVVSGFNPDKVFIKFGTNDYNHYSDKSEALNQQKAFLKKAVETYAGAKIYVITPIYRLDIGKKADMAGFEEYVSKLACQAREFPVTVIEGYKLMPHLDEFFADDLHPNDLGFATMALNLIKQL